MDRDLITRAQAGDTAAFEQLALASHARLQRTAVGILRDPHLAEDAVQAALLAIWRGLGQLRDPARFEAWSYRLLVRACYAEAKRAPAHTYDLRDIDHPAAGDHTDDVHFRDEMERAFRHLTLEQRSVLVLHYLVDLTSEQVAEVLDVRVGTVKSRLGRALSRMREAMATDTASARTDTPDPIQQEAVR
jgi:RNA polymerase sigma-70 factor (ECF subfamily)